MPKQLMPAEKGPSRSSARGGLIFFEPGRSRKDLIREVALAWFQIQPAEAREAAKQLRWMHKNQYNSRTGGWRNEDEYGYVKLRAPSTLMTLLRRLVPGRESGTKWGDDDKDLIELAREFPDMIPTNFRRDK